MSLNNILLLTLFVLETGMLTFIRGKFGIYISPVVFFILSMLTGLVPLFTRPGRNKLFIKSWLSDIPAKNIKLIIILIIFSSGILINALLLNNIFISFKPDYHVSDLIPFLHMQVGRFINGEFPYRPYYGFGYPVFPNYLPLQWMPFYLAEIMKLDYRWFAFIIWSLSIGYYLTAIFKKNYNYLKTIIISILPFLLLFLLIIYVRDIFENTVELMIAGFYIILAVTVKKQNIMEKSLGLILTLLSRFSIIFWVPLYLIVNYFSISVKKTIIIFIILIFSVLLIYYIPFMSKDSGIFTKGMEFYKKATEGEWGLKSFQSPADKPFHLIKGVGAAIYFYDFGNGTISRRIDNIWYLQIILSILVITLLLLFYFRHKNKIKTDIFLISSMKVYLTVFYTFIQIPYCYLFIVPVFVSVILLAENWNEEYYHD